MTIPNPTTNWKEKYFQFLRTLTHQKHDEDRKWILHSETVIMVSGCKDQNLGSISEDIL